MVIDLHLPNKSTGYLKAQLLLFWRQIGDIECITKSRLRYQCGPLNGATLHFGEPDDTLLIFSRTQRIGNALESFKPTA